jgi:hypothetical protein
MAERLGQIFEDELGEKAEGFRLAFAGETPSQGTVPGTR